MGRSFRGGRRLVCACRVRDFGYALMSPVATCFRIAVLVFVGAAAIFGVVFFGIFLQATWVSGFLVALGSGFIVWSFLLR